LSPLAIIFVTVFVDLLGFGIIIPLLPFYAERFGGSAQTVAMLSASFSAMQFVFMPIWGRLSDRIGRRPILLLGLFGSFASYLVFGLAGSLPLLFVSRMFAGIAGATVSTAQAFIADTTTAENRAKGMGLVGAAFGLGFIFGPAIGGVLSRWGHAVPPLFAAGLALANFVAAWFLLPESRPAHVPGTAKPGSRLESLQNALVRPTLPALLLVYVTVVAAFSGFETTFALFSERRFGFTEETIGYLFAYVGVVLAIVQGGLVGRMVKRFGERRLVPVALLAMAVGLALIAVSRSVAELFVANGILAVGMGFNSPALTSLISRRSDPEDQGGILGVSQGLASLARIVGPAWAGFLFDRWGMTSPYLSSAALVLVACGISVAGLKGRPVGGGREPEAAGMEAR
jgi:MFS transporter, DHA1 family, tetracycline resistance protein